MRSNLRVRMVAEFLGTAFLVAAVVGSGIMAERLANGNGALALLANTIATGAALVVLILTLGPISGAHFNPVVSVADAMEGDWIGPVFFRTSPRNSPVHCRNDGGARHVWDSADFRVAPHPGGAGQFLSEFIATFGLLCVIWGCSRSRPGIVPFAVGGYITAAYWFTASTSFANPAVTIARSLSDTFAGIRPADVPLFIVAQFAGGIAATILFRWLVPGLASSAKDMVVHHAAEIELPARPR